MQGIIEMVAKYLLTQLGDTALGNVFGPAYAKFKGEISFGINYELFLISNSGYMEMAIPLGRYRSLRLDISEILFYDPEFDQCTCSEGTSHGNCYCTKAYEDLRDLALKNIKEYEKAKSIHYKEMFVLSENWIFERYFLTPVKENKGKTVFQAYIDLRTRHLNNYDKNDGAYYRTLVRPILGIANSLQAPERRWDDVEFERICNGVVEQRSQVIAVLGALLDAAFLEEYRTFLDSTEYAKSLTNWLSLDYDSLPLASECKCDPNGPGEETEVPGGQKVVVSPIVLDLDGDGVETTDVNSGETMFDFDGDGVKNRTGWVSPDDGFLVFDRNGDGLINNGREMYSDVGNRECNRW